jgi:MipA family protein
MTLLRYGALILWVFSPFLSAEDIARDLRGNGSGAPNHMDGGYFELGFGVMHMIDPFVTEQGDCDSNDICPAIQASGAYHFRKAFIELADATYDGLNVGYTAWDNAHWAVDFIPVNILSEPSISDDHHSDDPQQQKELDLTQRSRLFTGSGTRITGYFGNTIVQYRFIADITGDRGATSSLRLGQSWQYRNWNFHSVLSADWFSAKAANYLIGISPAEATGRYPAYEVKSTLHYSAEVGLTYPLSTHWVGRAYVSYTFLPRQIYQSPLIDEKHASVTAVTISYAF